MTDIPIVYESLKSLSRAVAPAVQIFDAIINSGDSLLWDIAHTSRERVLKSSAMASLEVAGQIQLYPDLVTEELKRFPTIAIATAADLAAAIGQVNIDARAHNVMYRAWYDALPSTAKEFWASDLPEDQRPPYQELRKTRALTEEQARPLRQSPLTLALRNSFAAVTPTQP